MVQLTVGVNSYGTLAEADAYLDGSIRAAAIWIGVAPDDKRRALISAFRQIEKQAFIGSPTGVRVASAVAISAGGSGYSKGDVLTVSGGTFGEAAQVEVASVAAGVVSAVSLIHAGTYSAEPASPASTTGGGGSGATLALTFADQTIDFPRVGLVDCDGDDVASDSYPSDLRAAQFELAFAMQQEPDIETSSGTGSNLKSVGAGSAKVEFFRPTFDTERFPVQVQEFLRCFVSGQGGAMVGGFRGGADQPSTFDGFPESYGLTEGY